MTNVKKLYIYYSLIVVLVVGMALAFLSVLDYIEDSKRYELKKTVLMSITREQEDAIVAQMLFGAFDSLKLYEEKLQRDDGVDYVHIAVGSDNAKYGDVLICKPDGDGVCISSSNRSVQLVYPLIYGGKELGRVILIDNIEGESFLSGFYLLAIVLSLLLLTVISMAVFLKFLRKYYTNPIEIMKRSMPSIVEGKSKSIGDTANDEINDLIHHINDMIREIGSFQEVEKDRAKFAAMGKISSYIAHDLRSPLSVLKAYVGIVPRDEDCDMVEYRQAAGRSVNKLLRMTDDLVDFSKAGQVVRSVCNVTKLVSKDLLSEVCRRHDGRHIDVDIKRQGALYATIDADRIERVLSNMLDNAIEACSSEDEVAVRVNINNDDLIIQTADFGRGISSDDKHRIFDSFFTKGKKGGTGLGLAYCKQVVEAHGGRIDVESEVGKGTTFTIAIPNCVVDAAESCALRNEPSIKCNNRRFIIVDDDADIRLRWRKVVQDSGGTVAEEASSLEDVQYKENKIDFSAIDVAMVDYHYEGSKFCGSDVIKYMREKGISEVHLCTGHYDDEDVRNEAFSAGADSVMPKR